MITPIKMSKLYKDCYPLAITGYREESQEVSINNTEWDMNDAFELLQEERFNVLLKVLAGTVIKQVLSQIKKMEEIEELVLSQDTMDIILKNIVVLSESEPYGVRGGTLVVMFSPNPTAPPVKVGSFPLDSGKVSTFKLHLHLSSSTQPKHVLINLLRKIGGKPKKVVIDEKYLLSKKKLYRPSSTNSSLRTEANLVTGVQSLQQYC